jgi:hypothetical protein
MRLALLVLVIVVALSALAGGWKWGSFLQTLPASGAPATSTR